jgi:hypothetical protein
MVSQQQVLEALKHSNPKIEYARDMSIKLRLHVDGVGVTEYLERINNYENAQQYEAREKHAISNKFLTEELLRPTDNVFSAKGGSKSYKFKSGTKSSMEVFLQRLVNVNAGMSLSEFMENTWFHYHVVDPNGLIFVELPTPQQIELLDEDDPRLAARPVYKSIHSIRDYQQNGLMVDWVIFEPHEIQKVELEKEKREVEIKYFWVVDEAFYYLYKIEDGELSLAQPAIPNSFGYVPAVLCSNIPDYVSGLKRSPIHNQVELLNKYLVQNSVLKISEFFYNYPREWTYIDDCGFCGGSGKTQATGLIEGAPVQFNTCPTCNGSGKDDGRDVTDILKLRIPLEGQTKIDPPSGFTYMPTDAWTNMVESVDRTWDIIFFSQWGTRVEKGNGAEKETATGRFIDVQPIHTRLDKYSKSGEKTHTLLANILGKYYFPETFEGSIIQYGRRYLVETPDQIWEKYLNSKEKKSPVSVLDMLLSQFLESEYRENEEMFLYEDKKIRLEPFVHWDVEIVRASTIISNIDKAAKEYFNEWVLSIKKDVLISTDIEKLRVEFNEFVQAKLILIQEQQQKANEQAVKQAQALAAAVPQNQIQNE